jgi:hypothetical protein
MPRAIDHLVIPARDLTAQAELYERLGFQVGARNRHPWGTENHIVQFDGAFLELIGLGEGFATPAPTPGVYSFAGFVAQFLQRREGLAMLVMRSRDAEADRREFAQKGLGEFERFDFARKAIRPDGSRVDVAFSLAFAATPALPEAGFFVCQQHYPENFWSRAAQVHPNGATGIVGVVIAHETPAAVEAFLAGFVGSLPEAVHGGFSLRAQGAKIECCTPDAFSRRFGGPDVAFASRGLAAARIGVADPAATAKLMASRGVAFTQGEGSLVVDSRDAMGALIAFEAS